MNPKILALVEALIITLFYALITAFIEMITINRLFLTAIFGYMTVRLGYSLTRKESLKRFMSKFR